MAARTSRTSVNGGSDTSLAAAMTMLLQNQAQFVAHLDEDRQRFSRIEREMAEIKTLLLRHDEILRHHNEALIRLEQSVKGLPEMLKDLPEMLKNLPEAVRKKIGFQKS